MGTSTNRPKPKSGQSAASSTNGKPAANQGKTDAAEQVTKTPAQSVPSRAFTAKPAPKRETRREELGRKLEERRQQRERELRNQRLKRWAVWGIPAVVIVVLGVIVYNLLFGPGTPPYIRGDTIDGVECNAGEQLASHYHAHLELYINGQNIPIPTDVGRQAVGGCYYWLHTHPIANDAGVIHIESPDSRSYTVKQFFDIWGQQISATSLMGHKVSASEKLTAYVYDPTTQPTDDTQPWTVTPPSNLQPYTGDPSQITLKPHELIVIEYGAPVIPLSAFSFIAGE